MYSSARKYSSPTRAEVEHRDDVRVDQAGLQAALVDELADGVAVARQVRVHPLDDEGAHEALGAVGGGDEDLRHAAFADPFQQPVAAQRDARAGGRRLQHRRRGGRAGARGAASALGGRPVRGRMRSLSVRSAPWWAEPRWPLPIGRVITIGLSSVDLVRAAPAGQPDTSPAAPSSPPAAAISIPARARRRRRRPAARRPATTRDRARRPGRHGRRPS